MSKEFLRSDHWLWSYCVEARINYHNVDEHISSNICSIFFLIIFAYARDRDLSFAPIFRIHRPLSFSKLNCYKNVRKKSLILNSNLKIARQIRTVSKNNPAHRVQRVKMHIVGFSKIRNLKHEHFVRPLYKWRTTETLRLKCMLFNPKSMRAKVWNIGRTVFHVVEACPEH